MRRKKHVHGSRQTIRALHRCMDRVRRVDVKNVLTDRMSGFTEMEFFSDAKHPSTSSKENKKSPSQFHISDFHFETKDEIIDGSNRCHQIECKYLSLRTMD